MTFVTKKLTSRKKSESSRRGGRVCWVIVVESVVCSSVVDVGVGGKIKSTFLKKKLWLKFYYVLVLFTAGYFLLNFSVRWKFIKVETKINCYRSLLYLTKSFEKKWFGSRRRLGFWKIGRIREEVVLPPSHHTHMHTRTHTHTHSHTHTHACFIHCNVNAHTHSTSTTSHNH